MARRQAGARVPADERAGDDGGAVVTELDVPAVAEVAPEHDDGTGDQDAGGQPETAEAPDADRKSGKSGGDKSRRAGKGGALAPSRVAPEGEGGSVSGSGRSSATLRPRPRRAKALEPGASLTAAELADASGLEIADVERLEEYGLVTGRVVAGVRCYDEEGLIVARLAAGFARYGVEPRHLRTFKHAADREAGLFEQVVIPLLRQRNPEARSKANEALEELTELGAALQAALLGVALKDVTG